MTKIEELLLRSPAGREMLAQQQREEERKVLVAEIEALREESERVLPRLKQDVEEARQAALAARKALEKAEADFRGKNGVCAGVAARLQAGIARRLSALRESASPAIDEFLTQCRRVLNLTLNSFAVVTVPTGGVSVETGRAIVEQKNNAGDIERARQPIEVAIKEAEKLKVKALTDAQVAERLQTLAEMLPVAAKQQVLTVLDEREYGMVISERSEMVRLSQPWKDIKRGIRESRGLGSFHERRR
jgi:hypothetical protein